MDTRSRSAQCRGGALPRGDVVTPGALTSESTGLPGRLYAADPRRNRRGNSSRPSPFHPRPSPYRSGPIPNRSRTDTDQKSLWPAGI